MAQKLETNAHQCIAIPPAPRWKLPIEVGTQYEEGEEIIRGVRTGENIFGVNVFKGAGLKRLIEYLTAIQETFETVGLRVKNITDVSLENIENYQDPTLRKFVKTLQKLSGKKKDELVGKIFMSVTDSLLKSPKTIIELVESGQGKAFGANVNYGLGVLQLRQELEKARIKLLNRGDKIKGFTDQNFMEAKDLFSYEDLDTPIRMLQVKFGLVQDGDTGPTTYGLIKKINESEVPEHCKELKQKPKEKTLQEQPQAIPPIELSPLDNETQEISRQIHEYKAEMSRASNMPHVVTSDKTKDPLVVARDGLITLARQTEGRMASQRDTSAVTRGFIFSTSRTPSFPQSALRGLMPDPIMNPLIFNATALTNQVETRPSLENAGGRSKTRRRYDEGPIEPTDKEREYEQFIHSLQSQGEQEKREAMEEIMNPLVSALTNQVETRPSLENAGGRSKTRRRHDEGPIEPTDKEREYERFIHSLQSQGEQKKQKEIKKIRNARAAAKEKAKVYAREKMEKDKDKDKDKEEMQKEIEKMRNARAAAKEKAKVYAREKMEKDRKQKNK